MTKYPKIETLFVRDKKTFKVIPSEIRCPEFENIKNWLLTEKIHGTNTRVQYYREGNLQEGFNHQVIFKAKTDVGDLPPFLLEKLEQMFDLSKFNWEELKGIHRMCLYGEGYGARIQKGGGNYREGVSFRLCDIWIDGWWLDWDNVKDIANKLEIQTVPVLSPHTLREAVYLIQPGDDESGLKSVVAVEDGGKAETQAEGIVARAYPMVLFRNGTPVKWKLKREDY